MKAFEDEIPDWTETGLRKNKVVRKLVLQRQSISDQIKDLEVGKKEVSAQLFTIMSDADVQKAKFDDYTVSVVTQERESLNQGLLQKKLAEEGMDPKLIMKLWKECSTKSTTTFVNVRGPRE